MDQQIKAAVVSSLNLGHLPSDQQDKIVEMIVDVIGTKVNLAAWSRLSDEEKEKVGKIAKSSPERTVEHLSHTIPNFYKLVEDATRQTLENFKEKVAQMTQKSA
jgi:hypothetical protein